MASVNGSSSVFPGSIDFTSGNLFTNNVCQIAQASDWNHIEDCVFNIEIKTRRTWITGQNLVFTPVISGTARPHAMFKAYTVTVTGTSASQLVFVPGPAFTATELAMFPTPFASGNLIHTQLRKVPGDSYALFSYHCGLILPADTTGNSGFYVVTSTLRHGNGDSTIGPGTYVVSMMFTVH